MVSASKAIPNTVVFNSSEPIILVGDNKVGIWSKNDHRPLDNLLKGTVHCLKLSPNLRRSLEEETNLEDKDEKMDVSNWERDKHKDDISDHDHASEISISPMSTKLQSGAGLAPWKLYLTYQDKKPSWW